MGTVGVKVLRISRVRAYCKFKSSGYFKINLSSIFWLNNFFQLISAPCRAPDLVIAYNLSSTSLAVKWRHLPENYFQGEPISYRITNNQIASENNINVFSVNYTSNTTTLTNLTVYTVYVINVSAVSSGGIGPANTVKARTGAEGKMVYK